MTAPTVSVVIVSRHRPDELRKCLLALKFQTLPQFHVVVVGDTGIPSVLRGLQLEDGVTFRLFDEANISKARNIGIALASGDIVAFIDDDAVAEPTWLERLTAPFQQSDVAAAGGFVRGRNGISFQWQAEAIGQTGESEPIQINTTTILEGTDYRAIKTQGTNCAFRREVLLALGGFDESFHFYLDETDLNMRIAQAGLLTAIVPDAEVQHGFAKSARRGKNRAPRSLFNEGASQAYLLKKFGQDSAKFDAFRAHQRRRLMRSLVRGEIEPRDVARLLKTLEAGFLEGQKRETIPVEFIENGTSAPNFPSDGDQPQECLFGHWRKRAKLFQEAKALAASGVGVTVIVLSYTSLFHRRWFHQDGFWVQSGGLFGKSLRTDPVFKRYRMKARALREFEMLKNSRIFHSEPRQL